MKETTLSKSSSPTSQSAQSSDVETYQVDTVSTSSYQESQDEQDPDDLSDECETDGALAIPSDGKLPSFGSVSVVNSNDVHFGNKTVYKGPVTIKQFLYPNNSADPSHCVGVGENFVNKVDTRLDFIPSHINGLSNPAYDKDNSLNSDTAKDAYENNNPQETAPGIRKGFLWLKNLPKQHTRDIAIFFSLVILSITILTAVIYWRHPMHEPNGASYPLGDTDEQENNIPAEYLSDSNATINQRLQMISRQQWLAQPPKTKATPLKTPVHLVIIQHTATESCSSIAQCIFHVRHIQQYHIESYQWWDIGYNFLVGGDGCAYEGRGWTSEGAHTFGYNFKSIGVGFVGTFTDEKPPQKQIAAFNKLIQKGVDLGYIKKDYKILAARQLAGTESPGYAFYQEIQTWPHWLKDPQSAPNSSYV